MHKLQEFIRKEHGALMILIATLIVVGGLTTLAQRAPTTPLFLPEFPTHTSTVKEYLQNTKIAVDAKNIEKYLVVESAILGVKDNISLYFKDVNAEKTISINPSRSWIPASTIKAYVAVEAFRQQRIGLINLDQTIKIQPENVVPTEMETSELPVLNEGTQVTIRQLVESMIIQSDNTAYNTLLDILDRRNINATLRNLGITETVVGEKLNLDDTQFQRDLAVPGRQPNTTTAKDFASLFDLLSHNQIADSDKILAIFKRQKINSMIPALLPPNISVAHKTGDWAPIFHDGGIVYKPNDPFILVLFTNSNNQSILAKMAKVAYDQTADSVGNGAALQSVPQKKTSKSDLHRYLAFTPTTAVLGEQTKNTSQVYIVQKGDTWWSIAQKFYGDGNRWVDITRRNFIPDNASITVGTQLIIPSIPIVTDTENAKFPQITAADLGVTTADVTTDVTDAKAIKGALVTPLSILYPIKRFFDHEKVINAVSNSSKVDAYISASGSRLSEVKTLLANGDTKQVPKLLSDSEVNLAAATDLIKKDKSLTSKLLQIKQLTDLHYALFASTGISKGNISKQEMVDALYNFYTQNQQHVAPVVRSSVSANPILQQPIIGTVEKVKKNSITLRFDNGTTRDISLSPATTVRDFHKSVPDVKPQIQIGSKIAVVGETTSTKSIQPLFILRNIPKELPDKHEGTVLDVNPQKNTIEILNKDGKREEVIVNDATVVRGKDTVVSIGGITPGSHVVVFGETQSSSSATSAKTSITPSVTEKITLAITPTSAPTSAKLTKTLTPKIIGKPLVHPTIKPNISSQNIKPTTTIQSAPPTVIKATSITVTQNGTGKNVKQEVQKPITQMQSLPKPQTSQPSHSKSGTKSEPAASNPSKTKK